MKIRKRLAALPLTALVSLASNAQQVPTPADTAAAARTNAEQNQQIQQQRDAQQRAATIAAPVVRSAAPVAGEWPVLPVEMPCFRIDSFAVEVPDTLPEAVRVKGASALPMDPFAFLHDWLQHYEGQCVGKQGLDVLTKGLQGAIPGFQCGTCRRKFSRRSGTPFVNTKMSTFERMTEFIRYLALPLSIMQVSEIVGTSAAMVQKWRDKFAEFAEQLEPGGRLSSTIRLGVTPDGTTPCPFCGRARTAQHADNRGWSCAGCGRLFSMRRRVVDRNGGLCILSDEASSAPGQPTTSSGIQL